MPNHYTSPFKPIIDPDLDAEVFSLFKKLMLIRIGALTISFLPWLFRLSGPIKPILCDVGILVFLIAQVVIVFVSIKYKISLASGATLSRWSASPTIFVLTITGHIVIALVAGALATGLTISIFR